MAPTAAEVLETAMSLSPDERVDVATQLLRSAGTEDAARLEALRTDVAAGFAQIDRGEGTVLETDAIDSYFDRLFTSAVERAAKTA